MDPPDAQRFDPLLRQQLVDLGPLVGGEVGGGGDDGGRLVLAQRTGGVQLPHPGVPVVQVPRDPHASTALGRRHPARESDPGGDAAFERFRIDGSRRGLRFRVCSCEGENSLGLLGGDRRLLFFESRDPFDEQHLGRCAGTDRCHTWILPGVTRRSERLFEPFPWILRDRSENATIPQPGGKGAGARCT
nr:hypothetical protein [Pseudonocardia oceani]